MGTDHLGSTLRVTDSGFSALAGDARRYTPYGKSRDPRAARYTDRQFTGQTEDGSIELYWYQSRAYEPFLGRFVQPDSIVPAPKDPQSLNRYSYVLNNPLKYTDPSGHDPLPEWEKQFRSLFGHDPSDEHRQAFLASLIIPGTGDGGVWTDSDWDDYWRAAWTAQQAGMGGLNRWLVGRIDYHRSRLGITGTEQFVFYVQELARVGRYTSKEVGQFVNAIGLIFAGIAYNYAGGRPSQTAPHSMALTEPSGLRQQFRPEDGAISQLHHYALFLVVGYHNGAIGGAIGNRVQERWPFRAPDPGDLPLGDLAAIHGARLGLAGAMELTSGQPVTPGILAEWIRVDIAEIR